MKQFSVRTQLILIAGILLTTFILVWILNTLSKQFIPSPAQTTQNKSEQTPQNAKQPIQPADKYLIAEAALLGVTNNVSYYFKDFTTGDQSSLQPTRSWIPASTIKAYVAIEAFRQAQLGLIDFNQTVTIQAKNVVANELETDEFPRLREGTTATIRQLVEAMIIQSDNIAYNTLLDILDRRSINNTLHGLGLTESVVGQKLNLDDNQTAIDVTVSGYQINTTTAKDFASLFDLLYTHQIPGADEILAIFKKQKINDMIPALLPSDVQIAHKTGDWAPIFHDGGIVYKPEDPFILAVFSNSGRPDVIANLARVAYFRNADSVGVVPIPKTQAESNYPPVYLAESEVPNVLAAETQTQDKFPTITASDLGITEKDLGVNTRNTMRVRAAIITPDSPLYGVKRYWEKVQYFFAITTDQKANTLMAQSIARLSEAKTLYAKGEIGVAQQLIDQSQSSLASGANVANTSSNKDQLLTKTKQVSDLQFATLGSVSANIPSPEKEQFVDSVYNLYQKQAETVQPLIKNSAISNPTEQTPAIATVQKIENGQITVQTDNGQTKQLLVTDLTPVREFQSNTSVDIGDIKAGQKIAILGQTNKNGEIVPQFILNKLPQELPNKIQGTVLEINPQNNTIKIQDKNGLQTIIQTTADTIVRSAQTNISLEGIRAGSQVTIFTTGLVSSPSASIASPTPNASSSASPSSSSYPKTTTIPTTTVTQLATVPPTPTTIPQQASGLPMPNPTKTGLQTPKPSTPNVVQAITVTVTKNGSGVGEKTRTKPAPSQNKPAAPNNQPAPPPATPANKK